VLHGLYTADEVAHRAVAQDTRAARIGGDQPADLRGAFRPKMQRKLPVFCGSNLMDMRQGHARVDRQHIGRAVHRANLRHAPQPDDERRLALACRRHGAVAKPRIAAEGKHGRAVLARDRHDGRKLLGRGRKYHGIGTAGHASPEVGDERGHVAFLNEEPLLSKNRAKALDQCVHAAFAPAISPKAASRPRLVSALGSESGSRTVPAPMPASFM
jgi:hypothetical protein